MNTKQARRALAVALFLVAAAGMALFVPAPARGQAVGLSGKELYAALKKFDLGGGSARVENLALVRDRVQMTFTGTFYFEKPIAGRIYGAVFIGNGTFKAAAPPLDYERANVRLMLNTDDVESDFHTAVLRFTDDTLKTIGEKITPDAQAPSDALKLAEDFEPRFIKETAANVSARLAVSILNEEQPGFFLAQFDKGSRGRFTFLLDYQERMPAGIFGIDAGEKGLILAHNKLFQTPDIWMAFFSLRDFQNKEVKYSDVNELARVTHYRMDVDVRKPKKDLAVRVTMNLKTRAGGVRAIPFFINEDLPEADSVRLKKAMRLTGVSSPDGRAVEAIQEDWDGGVTVFLPAPVAAGQTLTLVMSFEGKFMQRPVDDLDCYYPRATTDWYPRTGFYDRSTFDLVFRHDKHQQVASVGRFVGDKADPDDPSGTVTEWRCDFPIPIATFAVGRFEVYADTPMVGKAAVPVSLYAPKGHVKEDFVVAEMGNCLRYFSALFGRYEYPDLNAIYFPYDFGQGLPTLLLLPKADWAIPRTFRFIAHETSHQWWGDMVGWRSYRDQWLSEGFADYSAILYDSRREGMGAAYDAIKTFRFDLSSPAFGEMGAGKGPVADIGPLILGRRLSTRASYNGYTTLIYEKGALVLRMLHFLFTDPQTGNDKAFFDMMKDFVNTYRNRWASTGDFVRIANRHFPSTPIAKKYHMRDLDWFFREWVYEAYLPSYRLEYREVPQANGSVILRCKLYQDGVPKDWGMPLPLVMRFGKHRSARGTVLAYGPEQTFNIGLPKRPDKVELDPNSWILSKETSEKKIH